MPQALLDVPLWIWPYALAGPVAFVAFGIDKRRATRGERRIPEATLHLIELLGGWPGALLAAQLFRHKRRKPRYLAVLFAIAALHLAVHAWWWSRG